MSSAEPVKAHPFQPADNFFQYQTGLLRRYSLHIQL